MVNRNETLIALENEFWQSLVDGDTDAALDLLSEPSVMVSAHGAMKFGHDDYRDMAEKGPMIVKSYELSDMEVLFPNDATAVLTYHVKQEVAPRKKGDGTASFQEMNDSSTWVKEGSAWKCIMHTETPAVAPPPAH